MRFWRTALSLVPPLLLSVTLCMCDLLSGWDEVLFCSNQSAVTDVSVLNMWSQLLVAVNFCCVVLNKLIFFPYIDLQQLVQLSPSHPRLSPFFLEQEHVSLFFLPSTKLWLAKKSEREWELSGCSAEKMNVVLPHFFHLPLYFFKVQKITGLTTPGRSKIFTKTFSQFVFWAYNQII